MKNKKGFTIYIDENIYKCLKEYVLSNGMTIAGLIRKKINEELQGKCNEESKQNN